MDRTLENFNYDRIGNSEFVVGIDIGSEFSGYAFSTRWDMMHGPPRISTHSWQGSKLLLHKCPTAILFDIHEKINAFGFEAENQYSKILADEEQDDYYYFKSFRNAIHQREAGSEMIKDVSGKPLKALQVMGQTIGYFKHNAMNKIRDRLRNYLDDDGFYFVVTVPASWNDQERHFMKQAAHVAGIKEDKLSIVCESEAALLFMSTIKTSSDNTIAVMKSIKNGEKYMVIDIGGSVKVTCNCQTETIQDIVPPSGGPWGGKSVDDAFYAFLCKICGTHTMENFRLKEHEDYIDLFQEYQTKKHSIRSDQIHTVIITLPVSLIYLVEQKHRVFQTAIEQSPYKETVRYNKQKLFIPSDTFRGIFVVPSIRAIIKHIEEMQKIPKVEDIDILMMVGGFVECELVQDAVRSYFGNSKSIIIPEKAAGMAVMKGAVLLAFESKDEERRKARFSYGVSYLADWDPGIHPESKSVLINGKRRCKDVFCKLVTIGEVFRKNYESSAVILVPDNSSNTFPCQIYVSPDPNPRYTTDPGCKQMLSFPVSVPITDHDLKVEATLIFSVLEILVRVRDLEFGIITEKCMEYPDFPNERETVWYH